MNFLDFFTNYRQGHRLGNSLKFHFIVLPIFENISIISMHNIYWDTLSILRAKFQNLLHPLLHVTYFICRSGHNKVANFQHKVHCRWKITMLLKLGIHNFHNLIQILQFQELLSGLIIYILLCAPNIL